VHDAATSLKVRKLSLCKQALKDIGTCAQDVRRKLRPQIKDLEACIVELDDASDSDSSEDEGEQDEDEGANCAFCFVKTPTIVFMDCGHRTCCTSCAFKHIDKDFSCPSCLTDITTDPVRCNGGKVANVNTEVYDGCFMCDWAEEPNALLMPCAHVITCLECAEKDGGMKKCPMCFEDVDSIHKIYTGGGDMS
jgi:hypothetical protein